MLKKEALETIEQTIGYQFKDKQLISQAFTRSSYHYEHPEEQSNEVMEFVGDSVLSLLVVDNLLDRYTDKDGSGLYSCLNEGDFSSIRSFMVNKSFLAKKMRKLALHQFLRMSIGDEKQGIEKSISVLEDLFESIVGAIYLDVGRNLNKTKKIVLPLLEIENDEISSVALDGFRLAIYRKKVILNYFSFLISLINSSLSSSRSTCSNNSSPEVNFLSLFFISSS